MRSDPAGSVSLAAVNSNLTRIICGEWGMQQERAISLQVREGGVQWEKERRRQSKGEINGCLKTGLGGRVSGRWREAAEASDYRCSGAVPQEGPQHGNLQWQQKDNKGGEKLDVKLAENILNQQLWKQDTCREDEWAHLCERLIKL